MSNIDHPAPEAWRPVPGFESAYEVSDHGRLRSLPRVARNGIHVRGGICHGSVNSSGHISVTLSAAGNRRYTCVHTLVLEAFVGPRPDGMEACHGEGGPADNRVTNLRWDSRSENKLDEVRAGRHHNTKKSACPRNHALEAPNLVKAQLALGWRQCRACATEHAAAYRQGRSFDSARADAQYTRIARAAVAA